MRAVSRRELVASVAGLLLMGTAGVVLYAAWSDRGVEVAVQSYAGSGCSSVAWPSAVAGEKSVATDPRSARTAAWGDPAVIASCGWPALGPTTSECLDVDGVYWVAERLSDGAKFTTYGRDPAIVVLVPKAYAPEPLLLPAFANAAKALPDTGRRCS